MMSVGTPTCCEKGVSSIIYKHTKGDSVVVEKQYTREPSMSQFIREAFLGYTLPQHRNLVHFQDLTTNPKMSLWMNAGQSDLQQKTNQIFHLTWEQVVSVIQQLFQGLTVFHQRGFWHMDVKPENILVLHWPTDEKTEPHIQLIDFGLSMSDLVRLPMEPCDHVTIPYRPPDYLRQTRGWHPKTLPNDKADVYAAGLVSLQLLYHWMWSSDQDYLVWTRFLKDITNDKMATHLRVSQVMFDAYPDTKPCGAQEIMLYLFGDPPKRQPDHTHAKLDILVNSLWPTQALYPEERPTAQQILTCLQTLSGKYGNPEDQNIPRLFSPISLVSSRVTTITDATFTWINNDDVRKEMLVVQQDFKRILKEAPESSSWLQEIERMMRYAPDLEPKLLPVFFVALFLFMFPLLAAETDQWLERQSSPSWWTRFFQLIQALPPKHTDKSKCG